MSDELQQLRRAAAWVCGMTDTVRRALEKDDPSRTISVGRDFPIVLAGRPGECGPNPVLRTCWPARTEGPADAVRIEEIVSTLARIQVVNRALSRALDGFAVPEAPVEEMMEVVGRPPA
jgi:hypothetical protein